MSVRRKYLGEYRLGKTIGQGAFSKVKLGYHKETGQKVAIKIIDKKVAAAKAKKAAEATARREQKAKAAAAVEVNFNSSGSSANGSSRVKDGREGENKPRRSREDQYKEKNQAGRDADGGGKEKDVDPGVKKSEGNLHLAPTLVQRLSAEVQLLMRLDHPNIIRLYQVLESEDECYVIMEHASGGELIDYIAAKKYLSEKEARKFFRQIISAVDHCHAAHVVHRDLKLENLLLSADKNLLISDFGLGRTFSTHVDDYMKTFCGTPNYAAVELISGIPYIGMKADVWAMGVVLYIMTAGSPPFVGQNISGLYSKIKALDYKCPDHFSKELRALLKKILVKDPNERISVDGIRNDPWVNFEEEGPPPRIDPKLCDSDLNHKAEDPSSLAKLISGITNDTQFITYTFTQRADMEAKREHMLAGMAPPESTLAAKHQAIVRRRRSLASTSPGILMNGGAALGSDNVQTPRTWEGANPIQEEQDSSVSQTSNADSVNSSRTGSRPSSANSSSMGISSTPGTLPRTRILSGERDLRPRRHTSGFVKMQRPVTLAGETALASLTSTPTTSTNLKRRASTASSAYVPVVTMNRPTYDVEEFEVPGIQRNRRMSLDLLSMNVACSNDGRGGVPRISMKEIEAFHTLLRPAKEIRVGRFAFSGTTTSSEAPSTIFSELHRALVELQETVYPTLRFQRSDPDFYMFTCRVSKNGADVPPPSPGVPSSPSLVSSLFPPSKRASLKPELRDEFDAEDSRSQHQRANSSASGSINMGQPSSIMPITASSENDVVFEAEVCKIWLLKLHGVRVKRKSGSAFYYKDIYTQLTDRLSL